MVAAAEAAVGAAEAVAGVAEARAEAAGACAAEEVKKRQELVQTHAAEAKASGCTGVTLTAVPASSC